MCFSADAMWGLACTSFIVILLAWAVWFSGMCKGKREEFIHVEYSTAIQHMTVPGRRVNGKPASTVGALCVGL